LFISRLPPIKNLSCVEQTLAYEYTARYKHHMQVKLEYYYMGKVRKADDGETEILPI
jgi:hypothetical protein